MTFSLHGSSSLRRTVFGLLRNSRHTIRESACRLPVMAEILHLPKELRQLVNDAVRSLGNVIRELEGKATFERIEKIRTSMSEGAQLNRESQEKILGKHTRSFSKYKHSELETIARAFALMMELVNTCESAYRTHRLRKRAPEKSAPPQEHGQVIYLVMTSHPTEARSPDVIYFFDQLREDLIRALTSGYPSVELRIEGLLKILWQQNLARKRRPRVKDEADYLFSISLRPEILRSLIELKKNGQNLFMRSWVGGDKDGHPGVGPKEFRQSLQISRRYIYEFATSLESEITKDCERVFRGTTLPIQKWKPLSFQWQKCRKSLRNCRTLKNDDGQRILQLHRNLRSLKSEFEKVFHTLPASLRDLEALLHLFPAMVVPLEFREDASEIRNLLKKSRLGNRGISGMLRSAGQLGKGLRIEDYVRGFVVSMATEEEDLLNAARLQERILGRQLIAVVPLFETKQALLDSTEIIKKYLSRKKVRDFSHKKWSSKIEVMLGYSDSAKESGVLPSRVLISEALHELDRTIAAAKLIPVFFHGSGGSVARGGGSISEQCAWWPKSSVRRYKVTIQGEMVQRNFASSQILLSMLSHIEKLMRKPLHKKRPGAKSARSLLKKFADSIRGEYSGTLADPAFLNLIQQATPYRFLSALRLGSRPSKRRNLTGVRDLRAIPWVLCWTQTRTLFPAWWGFGSAWNSLSAKEKNTLKALATQDPLLSSFLKQLGFTLEKVELPVWKIYLDESELSLRDKHAFYARFKDEYEKSLRAIRGLNGKTDLLWFRPWLGESIALRSPMIHPLNIVQIIALKRKDLPLLRQSVTGISSGMLTTG